MQRLRRLVARKVVLAALAGALALATGAAVTAPAAEASITPACNWQPLYLLNGWQSDQGTFDTGDPMYCVDNGVTYLAGSMSQPGGGSWEFAQLPAQAVPTSTLYLSVYTYGGTAGVLRIDPNGDMYAYQGNDTKFTSLAGVSFPAAQSAPAATPLSLQNGWYSEQGQYNTGSPAYFVSGGIVHLSGSIATSQSTPANGFFAAIPAAIQPDNCTETNVYAYGGANGALGITGNSDLPLPSWVPNSLFVQDTGQAVGETGPSTTAFTSLAGVAYPAAGAAWQPLSLINGWYNGADNCNNGAPSYDVSGGIVYLNGLLTQAPIGNCAFAVLPLAARPAHSLYFTVNAEGLGNANVEIRPDGTTCAWSNGPYNGGSDVVASLGGISYQRSA